MNYVEDDTQYVKKEIDLAAFRHESARYVRSMILACLKHQPEIISEEMKVLWNVKNYQEDVHTTEFHLRNAALSLATLNQKYLERCGSGGIAPGDESELCELMELLAFFTQPEGGAPDHNFQIYQVIGRIKTKQDFMWEDFAQWENLGRVRELLDKLPSTHIELPGRDTREDHGGLEHYVVEEKDVWIDRAKASVKIDNFNQDFSRAALSFKLLIFLLQNKSKFLTMRDLSDNWSNLGGKEYPVESTVRSEVRRLNELLMEMDLKVQSLRGFGYKIMICQTNNL
jgi:hypothetical protein